MIRVFRRLGLAGVLALALIPLVAFVAVAGPVTLRWDPSAGATSYDVEQSVDGGQTWTLARTVSAPTACTGTPPSCGVTLIAPPLGVVLFRFAAVNAAGRGVRLGSGIWRCESCDVPPITNLSTP